MTVDPAYALSGFLVGVLVGQTGVGGGSLMTPILILIFAIRPATAVGTDLLYAATTKAVGTAVHGFRGSVAWRIALWLAAGSLPLAALTLYFVSQGRIDSRGMATTLDSLLGIALLFAAVSLFARGRTIAWLGPKVARLSPRARIGLTIGTGAVLGVLVPLTSVGAGALGITALMLLHPEIPLVRLVGADIAHAVGLTALAGYGHWRIGSVEWPLLASLLAGSIPGIALSSFYATRVPEWVIRPVLATVLIVVGGRLLL